MRFGALVTLGILIATLGAAPVTVSINDKPLAASAIVRNGRVLLPFRLIFGALKASVSYDARTHMVRAQRGVDRIALRVGTHESVVLAQRLYVPIRYISESLGARVQYDAVDRAVFITDPRATGQIANARGSSFGDPNVADAPATPLPGYTPPIPYATGNDYPAFYQSMNFYIPTNQYVYFPGDVMQLVLTAPPGGTAYLDLCGMGRMQFNNPLGSSQYFLSFVVPRRLSGHSCWIRANYFGALGAQRSIALPNEIAFPATTATPTATPSPTPAPTPSPKPTVKPTPGTKRTQPVGRSPQSSKQRTPSPHPQGKPTP